MSMDPTAARPSPRPGQFDRGPLTVATLRAAVRWWKARRAIARLSSYPDRMLEDIGLSRGGIPWAVLHGRSEVAGRRREKDKDEE